VRVLLVGANGFIGSAVLGRLRIRGHAVLAVLRDAGAAARLGPLAETAVVDMARAKPETWLAHLAGVDAVVNCAGVLQDSARDSTGIHAGGAASLFAACERAGVRRVIHLSAVGVDRATPTHFSRSKRAGDEDLMARDLDWVILRPSVVVGAGAYGGSALFRGLAALPWLPVLRDTGPLQIVQLDEVVETVLMLIDRSQPARCVLELVGPQRLTIQEVIAAYRQWLGRPPALPIALPSPLMAMMYRFGDIAGWLGWRPPIRSTAQREILRGAVGDPSGWTAATGIVPQSLAEALGARPASVQERWFAQLYLLKPVVFVVLAAFWIITGLLSVGPGFGIGRGLMHEGGVGEPWASLSVIAGGLADILIGVGIAIRRTTRLGLFAAVALSLFYAAAGTVLLPQLWIEPLGPILKIWPILVLHLVALAILDDR
jgi:uncharacterized protein YbjT (DUF2867 family)